MSPVFFGTAKLEAEDVSNTLCVATMGILEVHVLSMFVLFMC